MSDNNDLPEDIRLFSTIEAVRIVPEMWIGGKDQRALHTVIWCLIGHALNEILAKPGKELRVLIEPGNVVHIVDDGLGLPVTIGEWTHRPLVETAVTASMGASKWKVRPEHPHHRHHAADFVGLVVPNALAEQFIVEVKQQGYLWRIGYARGERQTELEQVEALADAAETGSAITFAPDYSVFEAVEIDHQYMYQGLRELAFLMNELTVKFEDRRSDVAHKSTVFHFPEGTADFVQRLNRNHQTLHDPIVIRETVSVKSENGYEATLEVDIALQYTATQESMILNFVNGEEAKEGGVHIDGFLEGWVFSPYSLQLVLGGLTAVISIWHPAPQFASPHPTPTKLINPEIKAAMIEIGRNTHIHLLEKSPEIMDAINTQFKHNQVVSDGRRYGY